MAAKNKTNINIPIVVLCFLVGVILFGAIFSKIGSLAKHHPTQQTYYGTFPCADCSGISTTLILNSNTRPPSKRGTYILNQVYQGKSTKPLTTAGKWIVTRGSAEDPNETVLTLSPGDPNNLAYYLVVNPKTLMMLGQSKQKINSPFNLTLRATNHPPTSVSPTTTLANPASVNCSEKGGTLVMKQLGNGGTYGLCQFEDNQACEEWALYRGDCPVGGVKTTGFDTVPQQYCAWIGGQTLATPNASCTLPDGNVCRDDALYSGTCQ